MNKSFAPKISKPGMWISSFVFFINIVFLIIILSIPNFTNKNKIYYSIDIAFSYVLQTSLFIKLSSYKLSTSFSFRYNQKKEDVTINSMYIFINIIIWISFTGLLTYLSFVEFSTNRLFNILITVFVESISFLLCIILFILMQSSIIKGSSSNDEEIVVFKYKKHNYNNSYLIKNKNKTAIIIDCGEGTHDLIRYCNLFNIRVTDLFLTHFHFDHISSISKLYKWNNEIILNINEISYGYFYGNDNSYNIQDYIKARTGIDRFPDFKINIYKNEQIITIDELEIKAIIVKGHTPDSTFFKIEKYNAIFVGDTLFLNDVGMHEFEYTNIDLFNESIRLIQIMNNDIEIYPGHYKSPFKSSEIISWEDILIKNED